MLELQPRDAELIDAVLLGGRQVAPDPHKALTRGELSVDLSSTKSREDPDELVGGLGCINDLLWIGVKRRAVKCRSEDIAVAIDDIGMARHRHGHYPKAPDLRFGCAASDGHDFDDPQGHHSKDKGKQRAGDEETGVAGFESLLCRPVGNDGHTGRRLEVPRPTWIVVEPLCCNRHRLAETCVINSSSDLGRRGGTGFANAFAGTGLASSAASTGFSSDAGTMVDAGIVGGALSTGGSAMETTGASTAAGAAARSGMSVRVVRSCLVAIGPSDRWRWFISSRVSGRVR